MLKKVSLKGLWPFKKSNQSKDKKVRPVLVVETPEEGLKILHCGVAPNVDIVAVHGLGGHRERSWTTQRGVNWLQHLLSRDIPNSRILTWGYDASPSRNRDRELQSLQNVSKKLVLDLYKMRETTKTQDRPIIFMAHSLGGDLVKSALNFSDLERERPFSSLDVISASTRGVFFFDTTELGISTVGIKNYLQNVEGTERENDESVQEAKWLLSVLNQYMSNCAKYRNVYITPRNGQEAIQKEETKDQSSSQLNSSYITIDANHNEINKFGSSDDIGYLRIREELFDILQNHARNLNVRITWEN